jgi:tol-pal system protein YbgF
MRPRTCVRAVVTAAVAMFAAVAVAAPPVEASRGVIRDEALRGRSPVDDATGSLSRAPGAPVADAGDPWREADAGVAAAAAGGGSGMGALVYEQQLLRQDVQELRGLVEQLSHRLERLEREGQERYLDIDRRLQQGSAVPATDVPPAPAGAGAAGGNDAERSAYAAAVDLMRQRQFQAAIDGFDSLLSAYPDGRYAVNAHYWLGELYLALPEAELERARQAFSQVINLYPDDAKVPDALYKLGIVHDRMGDPAKAREYLERVRRAHAGSTAAGLAEKYLATLP